MGIVKNNYKKIILNEKQIRKNNAEVVAIGAHGGVVPLMHLL
jgi:hypothetical protein